ncbi:hypothetical protein MMC13_004847 [Lambiella insularis]|nr:hypothetical protein [Lambiella insularis]
MPFREKMKKAFGRSPSISNASSPSSSTPVNSLSQFSEKSKKSKKKDKKGESDVYKIGDVMPKPKYRAPVDPQHKDRLDAFNFGGALAAIRRKSAQSQYSPMGSRMPSRMGSLASSRQGGPSRQQSVAVAPGLEEARDADDDVGNVGLSRHQTTEDTATGRESGDGLDDARTVTLGQGFQASKTMTNGNNLEASKMATNGHVNGIRS